MDALRALVKEKLPTWKLIEEETSLLRELRELPQKKHTLIFEAPAFIAPLAVVSITKIPIKDPENDVKTAIAESKRIIEKNIPSDFKHDEFKIEKTCIWNMNVISISTHIKTFSAILKTGSIIIPQNHKVMYVICGADFSNVQSLAHVICEAIQNRIPVLD